MPRDVIDEMLSEVKAELPDLDTQGLAVGARILVLSKMLEKRLDDWLKPYGIQLWGFDVLSSLRRSGAPFSQTPTELMRTCFLTSGAVTNRVNRLERLGLVARQSDAEDRRSIKVVLTESGREVIEHAFQYRIEGVGELFSVLARDEQSKLAELLRRLLLSLAQPESAENFRE